MAALVLVSAFVACAKEDWNQNQLGVGNPYASETDETEPAAEDTEDATTATPTAADASLDASLDAADARPADARTDARDATGG